MTDLNRRGAFAALSKVVAGVLLASCATTRAEIVYSNFQTPLDYYVGAFGPYEEIADDLFLDGTSRILQSVSVAYAAFDIPADAKPTMTLSIYAMNGESNAKTQNVISPGDLLFQQSICIVNSDGQLVTFTDNTGTVYLPDHVAVGLSFTGIGYGDPQLPDAGPLLLDPPTVGGSFPDFWIKGLDGDGPGWGLYDYSDANGSPIPANFAIQINAVPETGTLWNLLSIPVLFAVGSVINRRRASR